LDIIGQQLEVDEQHQFQEEGQQTEVEVQQQVQEKEQQRTEFEEQQVEQAIETSFEPQAGQDVEEGQQAEAASSMVTKTVPKKGKLPKKTTPSLPRRKSARLAFKGKSTVGGSAKHGGKSAVIPIPSDDSDNEARILENLLIHKEGQIEVLQEDLQRARNFNHFLEVENKQMKFHAAIHEARAIKYKKEAEKAQVRIEELIGEFDDEEEEDQPRQKRPRTIGLRKALEKQKAEEKAQFEAFPLTTLFEREIEENKEAWLERANQHLETKLEKENRDLEL